LPSYGLPASGDFISAGLPGVTDPAAHFSVNRLGFLYSEARSHRSSKDELPIGVIGGSTTECIALVEKERWPNVLERVLASQVVGRPVTVLNLGVSGQEDTRGHLATTVQLAAKLDLDVIRMDPNPSRTAHTERILRSSMLLMSMLISLIFAEIVLRLIGFNLVFYPTQVQFGWPDPVTLQDLYQPDSELLWVPKDYYSKVATWKGKRPSIVFMGDSCTQFGRYDKFLESIIHERDPNGAFTFVNVGVGGWSSYQGLQQLKRDVLPMEPRAITIYYGWNDHWTSFGIEDKEIGKFMVPPALLKIYSKSRVLQLINKAIFTLKPTTVQDKRKPERVSLSDFTSNILQMIQIAREGGITPILLTAPSSHKKGEEPAYLTDRWLNDLNELVPLHQKYVQAMRDIASRERVPLIDLYAEFGRLLRENPNRFF
jgi:lysophospholipase L1-like esterase